MVFEVAIRRSLRALGVRWTLQHDPVNSPHVAFFAAAGVARGQCLVVTDRTTSKKLAAAQLLADKAARDIQIGDPVYKRTMTYCVIAMVDLLRDLKAGSDDYVQARAVDDFSVAISAALLKEDVFLAIETAAAPWPELPGAGTMSAGPFYILAQLPDDARSSGLIRAPRNAFHFIGSCCW